MGRGRGTSLTLSPVRLAALRNPGHGSRQLMGAVGKNPLSWEKSSARPYRQRPSPDVLGTKMRTKLLLQILTLSSLRLLDLKPKYIEMLLLTEEP